MHRYPLKTSARFKYVWLYLNWEKFNGFNPADYKPEEVRQAKISHLTSIYEVMKPLGFWSENSQTGWYSVERIYTWVRTGKKPPPTQKEIEELETFLNPPVQLELF